MRLVIFDFCETLVPYQTADRFVDFVHEQTDFNNQGCLNVSKFLSFRPILIFFNKFFPKFNFEKRVHLLSLRGMNQDLLENLSEEFSKRIEADIIPELKNKLITHQQQGDDVIIISGGYEMYLQHFVKLLGVTACYGTKIDFKQGKCTGLIRGKDCMFENKVTVLENFIVDINFKYEKLLCYSDSETDLPILKYVDEPIVVSQRPQKWAKLRQFKEILWAFPNDDKRI